jgi:hypothetical protein
VCETGLRPLPNVAETVVDYDEARQDAHLRGERAPSLHRRRPQSLARGRLDPQRSRARFDGVLEARGLAGRLLALPLRARMLLATRAVLADLKYYAEHGTSSPRKQRRLARRARRGSRQQVGARLS